MAYAATVVAVATTANINLNSPGGTSTFDNCASGALVSGTSRVLLFLQTTNPYQNGVWIWNGATSPLTRPTTAGDQYAHSNTLDNTTVVPVVGGATYGGTCFGID